MPTYDQLWPVNCFGGARFCDAFTSTLPSITPPTTLIRIEATVTPNGTLHADTYYWWVEWRNISNAHLFDARYAFVLSSGTVVFFPGFPLGASFYRVYCENDGPTGSTDCIQVRTTHSVGCEGGGPGTGIRGKTWAGYFDDLGREWALQVDSDSVFDQARGFAPVSSSSVPPLPRQWRPRRVMATDGTGRKYFARVGRLDAQLWTGGATQFNVETSDRGLLVVTVQSKQPETRVSTVEAIPPVR